MKLKRLSIMPTSFKMDEGTRQFTCYGNVKGNIDHARDRTLNGAYVKSIKDHKTAGTMPKMFFMHNSFAYQPGVWIDAEEDDTGLKMTGELLETEEGDKIYKAIKLAQKHGLKSPYEFSIGYIPTKEEWNSAKQCNDLLELDIKEVSFVNFACNPLSTLESIKGDMQDGEMPSKRELEKFLHESGLSRRQAKSIANHYEPAGSSGIEGILSQFEGSFDS